MIDSHGDTIAGEASVFPEGETRLALVSREAVEGNIRSLSRETGGSNLLVDLASDAWGHGLVEAARTAVSAGAQTIGVSRTEDGVALRRGGIDAEIVVWNLPASGAREELAGFGLSAAASSPEALSVALGSGARSVWLDVGLRRSVGAVDHERLEAFARTLSSAGRGSAYLCGSDAVPLHDAERYLADEGIAVNALVSPIGPHSAAAREHAGIVCIGPEVFGLSETSAPVRKEMTPALSLRAPIIALKHADGDVGVSYGYTYRTREATTLALVPLGYGDGVDRSLGNRAQVLLRGQRHTIAGRVAMDASVLDVGQQPVRVGDVVEFFGDPVNGAPSAHDYAELLGISSAGVVAGITARVRRRWI